MLDKRLADALEAASWVVFQDAKLLGIPHLRDAIVKAAAHKALGRKYSLEIPKDPVNGPVVRRAFSRATTAASKALTNNSRIPLV